MRSLMGLIFPAALFSALTICAQAPAPEAARPEVYQFGKIRPDATIQHTFSFRNTATVPLEIGQVQLTPPLTVTKMTTRIEPGAEGTVSVEMKKPLKQGEFDGGVTILFKDGAREPLMFYVEGEIVPTIEFIPHKVVLLSTQRGHPKTAVVEIANHEAVPLDIPHAECNPARFDCELATVEPGRRYRLTVTLKGDGPGAQQIDTLLLPTSSREHPFLEIKAFSKIRDRVYAFPDSVEFDTINADYLRARPQMIGFLTRDITVFQAEGTDFRASAETDVPFLKVTTQTSLQFKDRVGLSVTVDPTKLKSGAVAGSIKVSTNDPDFPALVISVSGIVEGNW